MVIVGVNLKPAGRELLTWVLAKFTKPGDHVIALHVVASPCEAAALGIKTCDDNLDSIVGDYGGVCCTKQISLQVKVINGPSLRKVLIKEAKTYNADTLILGSASTRRSSFSLAKDCLRRLPVTCAVLVVQQGQIVFEKKGDLTDLGHISGPQNTTLQTVISVSCKRENQHELGRVASLSERCSSMEGRRGCFKSNCSHFDRNWSLPSKLIDSPHRVPHAYKYVLEHVQCSKRSCNMGLSNPTFNAPRIRSPHDIDILGPSKAGIDLQISLDNFLGQNKKDQQGALINKEQSSECIESGNKILGETHKRSCDTFENNKPTGWPLLHRTISMNSLNRPLKVSRRSVVEWALQLPDRPREVLEHHIESLERNRYSYSPLKNGYDCDSLLGKDRTQDERQIEFTNSMANPQVDCINRVASAIGRSAAVCQDNTCMVFELLELQKATNNFSVGNLIGQGGCSQVFQGVLSDGRVVAVKCLNASTPDSKQEFLTEVEVISCLHHCHIVQLIGYCVDSQNYFLIYNFASEGNLEQKLHNAGKGECVLPWDVRYKVAVGVAEALDYLHNRCARPVIHRDVKSSNILLSSDLEPQLTDFGLAKWVPSTSTHITCTDIVGTFGYLAPEYFMYGRVNEKTDVYSFGVVLLELITGKHPIGTIKPDRHENLVLWARPLVEDESSFDQIIDPKLEGAYNATQLKNLMVAAALCLQQSPYSRPRMNRILKLLTRGESEDLELSTKQEPIYKEIDEGYDMPNYGDCDIRTHLSLALLGLDDDVACQGIVGHSVNFACSNKFLEEYLGKHYNHSRNLE